MSEKVDNGVKKFFIVFLGFIVGLNLLSLVLFGHSLFYYFYNTIYIDDVKCNSMVGKCFIPILLICFFLIFKIYN